MSNRPQAWERVAAWRHDFQSFFAHGFNIRTKSGELATLRLNRAQQRLHEAACAQEAETGRVRLVVVKARQMGSSTYIAARKFARSVLWGRGVRCLTFAHVDDTSRRLAGMIRLAWEYYPREMKPDMRRLNEHELEWGKSLLQFYTGGRTAGERGRGHTLSDAWLSELQFMDSAKELLSGALQAVPDLPWTEVIFESTAKGGPVGAFYEFYAASERGETGFRTVFLPWYLSDEYRVEPPPGFALSTEKAPDGGMSEVDYAREYSLDPAQMAFRRAKIDGMSAMGASGQRLFGWEYPATVEEAFAGGESDSFISAADVDRARTRQLDPVIRSRLPAVWGLDVAPPSGCTALARRAGPDCYAIERKQGLDLQEQVNWVAQAFIHERPAKLFVDTSEPYGETLCFRLQSFAGLQGRVIGIKFGARADDPVKMLNKRAEMIVRMNAWLQGDVSIPDESQVAGGGATLAAELLTYRLVPTELKVQFESKKQMFARGLESPDGADALALTFAHMLEPGGDAHTTFAPVASPFELPGPTPLAPPPVHGTFIADIDEIW